MVKTCCVKQCHTRANQKAKERGISFYRFPVNKRKRAAWVKAVNRRDWAPNPYTYICSQHFEDGWHSDDPHDTNYAPTIFTPVTPKTVTSASAAARQEPPQQSQEQKAAEQLIRLAENFSTARNMKFSLACHDSYCKQKEPISPPQDEDTHSDVICQDPHYSDSDALLAENETLKHELADLKEELRRCKWSAEKIRGNDEKTRFYTGLPTFKVFMWLFNYLQPKARNMTFCTESATPPSDRQKSSKKLVQPIDQFFAVLMRLKLGLFVQDIAERFQISVETFTKIFMTWICLMYEELETINVFPSRDIIKGAMPRSFNKYPNLRVIIDCTEIHVEKSSSLITQNATFSNCKNHSTLKILIGITPTGVLSFVSEASDGRISNRQITVDSGFLDLLEPGDIVMADTGFAISDLLQEKDCTLNILPVMDDYARFTTQQVIQTQEIAELRKLVDHSIGRIKEFHIFDRVLHLFLVPIASKIFKVCSWLTNLDVPVVDIQV